MSITRCTACAWGRRTRGNAERVVTSYTAGLTVGGRYRVYVGYPIVPIESLVVCMLRCVFLWCVFCGVHVEVCMLWCTCCGVHVVVCML